MNFKAFAFAAALLAAGSTLAGTSPVAASGRGTPTVAPGCNGGRSPQFLEMSCAATSGRGVRAVTIMRCGDNTFTGKFDGPGPTDAAVTVLHMPVGKLIPKNGSNPGYVGSQPRGRTFNLSIDTKRPHKGGFLSIFTYGLPGANDQVQMNKIEMLCRPPQGGRG
jgi:hypothetical protein